MDETTSTHDKKNGMVALIGRSNVGKSTLVNTIVGTKVAITTPKPQTTRDVIQGVIHDPRGQVVFVDTPGLYAQSSDPLTSKLNEKAKDALEGVDVILYIVDATRHIGPEEENVHRVVKSAVGPKIMVMNKSDEDRPYIDEYLAWKDEFTAVIDVSALQDKGIKALKDLIFDLIPAGGVELYPQDRITNVDTRFWISELIREKLYLKLHEELPYTTRVVVHEIETREDGMVYVRAEIQTTDARYKKMIIGAGGLMVKRIGQSVRREIELVTSAHVFLDLRVEVEQRWQERFE